MQILILPSFKHSRNIWLIIKNLYITFKDVQVMLKRFFDNSTYFRFLKISVECSVHSCSCPWLLFSSELSHVTKSQNKNSKHMVSGDLKPPLGMTFQFFSWIQSGKLQLSISLRTFVKDIALNPLSKFSSLLIPLQSLPKPCATVYRIGQLAHS